ncbi:unnamed protein product, partial [Prorocentrum cordatum]
ANVSTSSAKNGTRSGRNGSAEPSGRNGSAGPSGRAGSARPAGRNGSANASRRNGSAKHSGRNGSTSSSGSKPGDANETAAADHLRDRQSQALAAHHELQSAKSLGSALEELHRRHQQQAAEHERDGTSTTGEGEDADEGGGGSNVLVVEPRGEFRWWRWSFPFSIRRRHLPPFCHAR